jgi:hypothetical protein
MGIHEGKRPLGKTRHSWEDNIKMDLEETYIGRVHVAQNRGQLEAVVNTVMRLTLYLPCIFSTKIYTLNTN